MTLLGARLYDPATAVARATTGNLAMTALDTTNLRIAFTVPSSGAVIVHLSGVINGATTYPMVMLGILEGSAVRARKVATGAPQGTAVASTYLGLDSVFVVPGLTPGVSLTWDAAYAVEVGVAATAIRYGGPNTATTSNDAWGAFGYEIWAA